MSGSDNIISRERPCWSGQAFRRRVNLGSGDVTAWTAGGTLALAEFLARVSRAGTTLSYCMAEPIETLPDVLPALLGAFGVEPERFELSIAAHRMSGCGIDTLLALSSLRDAGLGLSLVGLRAYQLGHLARLPLTTVVLDPMLVACLPGSKDALDEVRSMTIAAHLLGLDVVAAGVETPAQRSLLSRLGVIHGEGELFDD